MDARIYTRLFAVSLAALMISTTVHATSLELCPLNPEMTATADTGLARWQKERALYLHDLQLSTLEQKPGAHPAEELDLADELADADLYVAYARTDRLALASVQQARHDLSMALDKLDQAYVRAQGRIHKQIDGLRKSLLTLRDKTLTCFGSDDHQQRKAFDELRQAISHVVQNLG